MLELSENAKRTIADMDAVGAAMLRAGDKFRPSIKRDTPEWKAWRQWRIQHELPVAFMDTREEWTALQTWPPADLQAMLREWEGKSKGRASQRVRDALGDAA